MTILSIRKKSLFSPAIPTHLDEAPIAYKDIHQVMDYQKELKEVLGSFSPRIVRMCGDERFKEVD